MTNQTGVNDLRELFLRFFESKGHLRLPSFSLIPQNDASLLLINSGMAPMKPWFTGEQEPPRHRVTTCQKCIRTGDIENIGHTAATARILKCWATSPSAIISSATPSTGPGNS